MKWVFLSLNILLFNSTNFCQEVISDPEHEIFCGSENYNSQLTYKLEPIGTIWDVYWPNTTTHIFTIDTDGSSDGGFTRIGEFNNQTFDYIDNSILYTGEGGSVVSYKVTSYNGTEYTPTNIAVQEYYFEFDWSNGLILTNSSTHPKLV